MKASNFIVTVSAVTKYLDPAIVIAFFLLFVFFLSISVSMVLHEFCVQQVMIHSIFHLKINLLFLCTTAKCASTLFFNCIITFV